MNLYIFNSVELELVHLLLDLVKSNAVMLTLPNLKNKYGY